MDYEPIRGVIVPMLTPFNEDGGLDANATQKLTDYLIASGVRGLFPMGTTGEGPLLSIEERRTQAEVVVEAAAGRVPVIIHTGAVNTKDTIVLTHHAQLIGASAAGVIPPYFFPLSQQALTNHFVETANQTPDLPIYLYNNPAVAGNPIAYELVERVVNECPNIVGLKDSGGTLDVLFQANTLREGTFNTATGPDQLMLAAFAMGLDACVSGNANVFPQLVVGLYDAVERGDLVQARKLQARLNRVRAILKDGADLSLFKGILARRGLSVGTTRLPLMQASGAEIDICWQQLHAEGLELTPIH